jgi:DNA-binding NarL/FixJ family response regulator
MAIAIVIADDHPVVRRGLSQYFAMEKDLEVVGDCANGEAALDTVKRVKPDVLVLDLQMPVMGGMEVLRQLAKVPGGPATVLLAGNISDHEVMEAMKLGARGVVLKEMAPSLLIQCVRKVAAGGVWVERDAMGRVLDTLIRGEVERERTEEVLTCREIEIVQMIARGNSNRDIATKLFISEGTVKSHLHAIYEKLGLKGRVQLAMYATEHGLS